jgi:hypothetical protein
MSDNKNEKDLNSGLDQYLGQPNTQNEQSQDDCVGEECLIKTDKSIVERVNKKIITDDGRQLLM